MNQSEGVTLESLGYINHLIVKIFAIVGPSLAGSVGRYWWQILLFIKLLTLSNLIVALDSLVNQHQ